ncbi:MAG TPA: saccharopine dehydrogenase C-terminal domain-containing protein [Devosia sp.]|nr:saccharopine dehydrogenase C-terminal domain-containing protein [Devosia sp.]
MTVHTKYARIEDRIVLLGLGSIGQAVLPLLLRHLDVRPEQIEVFAADELGREIAEEYGLTLRVEAINKTNYRQQLDLTAGCFLINLSVGVSSKALIQLCRETGALYIDTCILPWPDEDSADLSATERSNYMLREDVFAMHKPGTPTAVVTMGANPGLASAFLKSALRSMAEDNQVDIHQSSPGQEDWARLARDLDIKAIHVAERDTQTSPQRRKRGEFVNTWSVRGLITEGLQPAELGWGTHERHWPSDAGRHNYGSDAAIFLNRPGAGTRVRSWTPLEGSYHGFLITHAESISIAEYLTIKDNDRVVYRPTVYYAYHPCDDAVLSLHEMAGKNWQEPKSVRIMRDEISTGMDELGILLMGNQKGVYWYGSRLSIEEARDLAEYNSATSLQVAAGVLSGMVWALRNPRAGIVEPDDIPADDILEVASPYLGEVVGVYGDWTPLQGREALFEEQVDRADPWQFKNFRVN